jgi:ElaB/YqjD/DUF883 family membrane-anchored ribosome-binding protein
MATQRQNQYIGATSAALATLCGFDIEKLVQREKLGQEFSFEVARPMLVDIVSTSQKLARMNLEAVPYGVLAGLQGNIQQLVILFQQVESFSPTTSGNPVQTRDAYIQQIEDQWNSLFSLSRQVLGPATEEAANKDIENLRIEIERALAGMDAASGLIKTRQAESEKQLDEFLSGQKTAVSSQLATVRAELEASLEQVRKAAAEAGVSMNAKYFDDEAKEFKTQARKWFWLLLALVVVLFSYAVAGGAVLDLIGLSPLPTGNGVLDGAKLVSQRALLAFVLIFSVVWASKNYSAARHNEVVNRHRRNSLGSFETLVKSASDLQTKNAVLIQATQSIFSPQATGFVKNDGEDASSTKVLEVFRGTTDRG